MAQETNYIISSKKLTYLEILHHFDETENDCAPQTKEFMLHYAKKLSTFAEFVTLRTHDNLICGLIAYYANIKPTVFVTRVWVTKSIRGMGWCKKMMDYIADKYNKDGFNCIKLEVRPDNLAAIKSYKRQGFIEVSQTDSKILMAKSIDS